MKLSSLEIDWQRLLLAGSIFAKSPKRGHQEIALRIATSAVSLSDSVKVKDAGGVLFDKLSNHRALELAERKHLTPANPNSRLGTFMRMEASRRTL